MKTKAQERTPQKTYGKQTARGNYGEAKAAEILRADGYKVSRAPQHPHGSADIVAVKGCKTRCIQVKRISSRVFLSAQTARNRMRGRPFNIEKIPKGIELWVFDAAGNLYKFKE